MIPLLGFLERGLKRRQHHLEHPGLKFRYRTVSAGLKGGQSGRFRGEPHSRPVMPKAHHNLDRLNETTAVTGRVFFPPDMRLVHEQASRAVR